MSHSITISISNKEIYLSSCQNLKEKLQSIIDSVDVPKKVKEEVSDYISTVNNIENTINTRSSYESEEYVSLMKNMSSIEKTVANVFVTAKNSILNNLINSLPEEFDICKKISKHGVLANETIEYMKSNGISINEENFDKYVLKVEELKLSEEKIKQYILNAFRMIDESKMPDSIKASLKKEIKAINSLDMIKDIYAIIQSKENEVLRTLELSKKVNSLLKKQGFEIVGQSIWEYDEKTSDVIHKFSLKNTNNNTVQMIADSSGHLRYKLGNYIGHACETTTERLLEDLRNTGCDCKIISIKRDYENTKTMAKELPKEHKGGIK